MAWPSSIPTFLTGIGGVTVAKLNDIRDALKAVGDPWTSYSPSWTSTGTLPTMGATTVAGSYRLTGKTVDIHILATVGAGFAAGTGNYRFTLPVGITPLRSTSRDWVGGCIVWDSSASTPFPLHVFQGSSTDVTLVTPTATRMSPTVPITLAAGDTISIHVVALELV